MSFRFETKGIRLSQPPVDLESDGKGRIRSLAVFLAPSSEGRLLGTCEAGGGNDEEGQFFEHESCRLE